MTENFNPVPWLRSGTGSVPSEGGCIMQVIDWIDRNQWTDSPPCVHPVLVRLAIRANDSLDDEGRQKLLDLAPRLMGTASDDKTVSVRLAVFCARKVLHLFEAKHPGDDRPRKSIEAAEAWIAEPSEENRQKALEARHAYAAAAYASDASDASYASYAAYAAASDASAAYAAAAYAAAAASDAAYPFLLEVLEEYERITEHKTTACQVDFSPAVRAMAGI